MTPNEKLRASIKGLRSLHTRLQNAPALVETVGGVEVNFPAAQLSVITKAIQDAADELSGIECRARTYDSPAIPLKTNWYGCWRDAIPASQKPKEKNR